MSILRTTTAGAVFLASEIRKMGYACFARLVDVRTGTLVVTTALKDFRIGKLFQNILEAGFVGL